MTGRGPERWLEFADEDLAMAELALERGIYRQACFHAQQAAEKALKAFLEARSGTHPKSHSLEQLLLFDTTNELQQWQEQCRTLDQFYLPTRYADALPEGAATEPASEDGRAALEAARVLVAEVRRRITS